MLTDTHACSRARLEWKKESAGEKIFFFFFYPSADAVAQKFVPLCQMVNTPLISCFGATVCYLR